MRIVILCDNAVLHERAVITQGGKVTLVSKQLGKVILKEKFESVEEALRDSSFSELLEAALCKTIID